MRLSPDKARAIIMGYERTINDALIELVSRTERWFPTRNILVNLLTEIADMRFGDPPSTRAHGFYSGPLYWDVFGPDPVGNVSYRLAWLTKANRVICRHDPAGLAERIRKFHNAFAFGCEEGDMDYHRIIGLLVEFEDGRVECSEEAC